MFHGETMEYVALTSSQPRAGSAVVSSGVFMGGGLVRGRPTLAGPP